MKPSRTAAVRSAMFSAAILGVSAAGLVGVSAPAAFAAPVTYEVDGSHTDVLFRAQHLISRVTGQFRRFSGTVTIDPGKRDSVKVSGRIEAASIDTDEPDRDTHLRSADFFDVARFPEITFEAGELSSVDADRRRGRLAGKLTMHGITRPITLDVEWLGAATDPWGNRKVAFTGKTTINRKDWGIVWNKTLDAGGFLVGDLVEIELNIEAGEPAPAAE